MININALFRYQIVYDFVLYSNKNIRSVFIKVTYNMEVALAATQSIQLSKASMTAVKQAAQAEQAIVDLVSQAADRGQNLNVLA